MTVTVSSLPQNSFLSDVRVYDVDGSQLVAATGAPVEGLVLDAIEQGVAVVSTREDLIPDGASSSIAIPVFRSGSVVSVVLLCSKSLPDGRDDVVGVFESWEPIGVYEELALSGGYYGRMDRFHNVSSFVRFEKGTGLPGQVWQQRTGVIHDDLSNHPGFLRAAGASADLLVTAVGIPVASTAFHGAALLISSVVSPLARGFEVWQADPDAYTLLGGAYRGFGDGIELPPQATLAGDTGLPGLAADAEGAVLSEDIDRIFAGRNLDVARPEAASGLAIPSYEGDQLTSVTTLLF